MNKLTNFPKAVWLPLIFIVAFISFETSRASAQQIEWYQDLTKAKEQARDSDRLVWLHFTADWCIPCKRLDSFALKNSSVIRAADRNTVAVKIDADAQAALVKQLDVPRIPYDIVMTPSGRVILNRQSPKDSVGFLKMFDSLDRPLQGLNDGDREVIDARLSKLQGVVKQSSGLRQQKSDLNLDNPSHEMAATTVEGQRLERGLESAERAAELRTIKAQLLKQKAKLYIAEQKKHQTDEQQPKFSDNPFVKTSESATGTAFPNDNQSSVSQKSAPKFVSNSFVAADSTTQRQSIGNESGSVPPMPPSFGNVTQKKSADETDQDLTLFKDRKEFSFGSATAKKPSIQTEKAEVKLAENFAAPKFTLPNFAEQKQSSFKVPDFGNSSTNRADNNKFAYAPVDELRKALPSEAKAGTPQETGVAQKTEVPIDNSFQNAFAGKTSSLSLAAPQRPVMPESPSRSQQLPAVSRQAKTYAQFEQPTMKTDVSTPQAPVMVEGVVKISETVVPAVEGRLVAAEQTFGESSLVRNGQSQDTIQKQLSRTDRMLENVNFFAKDSNPGAAPKTFAIPGQPVQQPQIVINLNSGNAAIPQPPKPTNRAIIIQPNSVAQASSTADVTSGSKSGADSAARSKYALKGKCPVTLLSQGRWVNGNKEIGCVHRDRVYLFASAANREAFLADPDRLSPLLAGFDPVIFEETGKLIEGEEAFGTFMGKKPNQRIVLFKTSDTRKRFQNDPSKYLNSVRRAMNNNAPQDTKLR